MKRFKKILSIILLVSIIMPLIPIGEIVALADGEIRIEEVRVFKDFDKDQNITKRGITIIGSNMNGAEVQIITRSGIIKLGIATSAAVQSFEIKDHSVESAITGVNIGAAIIDLDEGTMPNISLNGVAPRNLLYNGTLTLSGDNLDKVGTGGITAKLISGTNIQDISNKFGTDRSKATLVNVTGNGLQSIIFEKTGKIKYKVNGQLQAEEVKVDISHNYYNQLMIYKNIEVEGLQMTPNAGRKGTTVRFEALVNSEESKNLKNQDVFFLLRTDGTDPYSNVNKGKNRTNVTKEERADGTYNVFTVQVPDGIDVGEYYVVFTNPIPNNQNPADAVVEVMVLKDKFTVIQGGKEPSINNVDPPRGPNTGQEVTITGQYIGTMNINEFIPTPGNIIEYEIVGGKTLVVKYGGGTFGSGENPITITSAKREIKTIIGDEATYLEKDGKPLVSFTEGMDKIEVKTASLSETDPNPKKDVVIRTTTTFTKSDGTEIVYIERAEKKGGFEYIPSRVQPEILEITPSKIQVIRDAGTSFIVPAGRQIAIHGKNFMIHKYIDENGKEVVRYPKIEIGTITIDKNQNPEYDVKVLDDRGNILDGTENKEFGTKILFTMPNDKTISRIGQADVRVTNPMRNSNNDGFSHIQRNFAEFVTTEEHDNPVIEEVRPNTSPVEGGEKVTIVGSNFQPGLKVYIDGEEVKSPQVKSDGKQIDIVTPKGRETKTQIQVVNPKGGMDWKPFTYIIAYSQPKITSFNPPSGEEGTAVVIKGSGFLNPDPMASDEIPEKLIGTRVLLGDPKLKGSDVNEYNINPSSGEIEFIPFKPSKDLFTIKDGIIDVADYSSGIILKDDSGKKYVLNKHPDGRIILTDGGLNKYKIENINGVIKANKDGGGVYNVTDTGNEITLSGSETLTLTYSTAYKIDGNNIIGQHAKVIDSNTIYFYVPTRPSRGYYDLTVINPDTKKDTKEGNNGFLYLTPVGLRPTIESISPNKGDVSGGYPITIKGTNFAISEEDKAKVYIDGQLAVITDMAIDGTSLTVTVPKYTGNLRDKETSQLKVLVVVQNPSGLSAGREDLFSYIIPNTEPKINRIRPNQGSTGGDMIEIDGIGFLMQEINEDLNENGNKNDDLIDTNLSKEDRDKLAGKNTEIEPPYNHYYDSPILPKVYFGNDKIGYRQGKVLDFSGDSYLRVLAPANQGGKVDVYITNNDGGTSNKIPYTYIVADVSIKSINPSQSRKQGGIKADVRGTGFQNSEIQIYGSAGKNNMPLVKFGDITNKNLPREHENSGLTKGPVITVKLEGGLEASYRIDDKKLTLQIKEEDKYYKAELEYNNKTTYIPVNLLKSGSESYKGTELIKVSMEDRRLLVERGFAPITKLVNSTHIELETPSYFEAKQNVPIYVINPDRGQAQFTKFNYTNPESKPIITNILRDNLEPIPGDDGAIRVQQVNYKGGREIRILGKDFRKGAKITIEDFITIEPKDVEFISEEELRFIMPELKDLSKIDLLHKLRVENLDGGNALSTDSKPPIYIQFTKGESIPETDNIVPNRGPATGGTKVTIHGNDFRSEMDGFGGKLKVFFGAIEAKNVVIKDYKTLEVIAPASSKLGPVKVTIENPDGTLTGGNLIFTYISKPKINDIDPKKLFTNDTKTVVTLTGEQYLPGAKVIIGGKIIPTKDVKTDMILNGSGITGVDKDGNNIESSVVGGTETATVVVENDGTIKITFKEATDLENTSIIVINTDGGISEPFNDFRYEKPVPLKPMILEGIPGYESTVMLLWNKSDPDLLNRATRYEIYGRKTSDKENTFLGDTNGAEFLVKGLELNTEYTFMVRALNEHGAAIDFATVKVKTFSISEDKKLQEKEEKRKQEENKIKVNGKEEMQGGRLIITLGSNTFKNNVGTLDLTLAKYKNQDKFTISIPIELARKDNSLTIKDGTMTSVINVRDLYTIQVSKLDKGDKDAYLRIHIDRTVEQHIPRGKKVASKAYELYFDYIYGKDSIKINEILRNGKLSLTQDIITYPNNKNSAVYVFNVETGKYTSIRSTTTYIKGKSKVILLSDR